MKKLKFFGMMLLFVAFGSYVSCSHSDNQEMDSNPQFKLNSTVYIGYLDNDENFIVEGDGVETVVEDWEDHFQINITSVALEQKVMDNGEKYYLLVAETENGSIATEFYNVNNRLIKDFAESVVVTCNGCTEGCRVTKYEDRDGITKYRCAYPCSQCSKSETVTFKK